MADLEDLLVKTSRTFALSIPLLPEPTRREVTIAYLLFRIADTFEDAASWPQEERIAALDVFCDLLAEPDPEKTQYWARHWGAEVPTEHEGYSELMQHLPAVFEAFCDLGPEARKLVRQHTVRTAKGMAGFVARTDSKGELKLDDLEDLREYCYVVAGIVGELLTELFLLDRRRLRPIASYLSERSRAFGEALQLVNILRDSSFDLTEGRSYLPQGLERRDVLALARDDLSAASEYVLALQEAAAEDGIVAFNALPVLLAEATLDKVEVKGPGSKISRRQVSDIVAALELALASRRPVISLHSEVESEAEI